MVVSRSLHRSLLLGLVLAGLDPVWVSPAVNPATGLPTAVSVGEVEAALKAHPPTPVASTPTGWSVRSRRRTPPAPRVHRRDMMGS